MLSIFHRDLLHVILDRTFQERIHATRRCVLPREWLHVAIIDALDAKRVISTRTDSLVVLGARVLAAVDCSLIW